jgi:8-oxo-dGTP diphosphatase
MSAQQPITKPITALRRYPNAPLVGVGVAVFNAAGEILLVQRGRPPRAGTWGLPGGLIDLGERLVAASAREVMEEVGITIEVGELVTTYESIDLDDQGQVEYHYVVLEYWARYLDGDAVAQDDAAAVAWVDYADLDAYRLTPEQLDVLYKAHAAWQAATSSHSHTVPSIA